MSVGEKVIARLQVFTESLERGEDKLWYAICVGSNIHCVPRNDLRPHKKSKKCWCEPRFENKFNDPVSVDYDGPKIVIHMAADGRE